MKGEENVVADKFARIPWPVATPKAVEIIQLAGELELDIDAEEESDSDTEEEGEECIQEDNLLHGEVDLHGIEMMKEHQKGYTDCQSLAQWV